MSIWGSVISGVANIAGGLLSSHSAKSSQESNQDYNTDVLQNRHQWEVQDLKNAGLNPILSATNSSGGSGVSSSSAVDYQSTAQNIASNILAFSKLRSEIDNIKSNTAKNNSDIDVNNKNLDSLSISMVNSAKDGLIKDEELNRLKVMTRQAEETLKQMKVDTRNKQDVRDVKDAYGDSIIGKAIATAIERYGLGVR